MNVNIWPRGENEKGGYLCMPLQVNVPHPQQKGWKDAKCPMCGEDCWSSVAHEWLEKEQGVISVCTLCALKMARVALGEEK